MEKQLQGKFIQGRDFLIAYLDLCGTKSIYSKFELAQQIEWISEIINTVREDMDNMFGNKKNLLYLHMFTDSLVMVEKERNVIENSADKFLKFMLKIQYDILLNSERDIPTLSRAMIKRGEYYGMILSESQTIEEAFMNFSIVGGSTVVEMDETLKGLPMGVYIDDSITGELQLDKNRLIDVDGNPLKFVKPSQDSDFMRSVFSLDKGIEDWGKRLINFSDNNPEFKTKLIPWIDAILGRRRSIGKRQI
jgi:hypothetical protein